MCGSCCRRRSGRRWPSAAEPVAGDHGRRHRRHAHAAAPVHGVHGNVDEPKLRRRLPDTLELKIAEARIGVIHDAGPRRGRAERLRAIFPDTDCVVFGHSHVPEHARLGGSFQIFNPGSPTERRRAQNRSMGVLKVESGKVTLRHVAL